MLLCLRSQTLLLLSEIIRRRLETTAMNRIHVVLGHPASCIALKVKVETYNVMKPVCRQIQYISSLVAKRR